MRILLIVFTILSFLYEIITYTLIQHQKKSRFLKKWQISIQPTGIKLFWPIKKT